MALTSSGTTPSPAETSIVPDWHAQGQPMYSTPPPGWQDIAPAWGNVGGLKWSDLKPEQRQGVWSNYQSSGPGQEAKSLASYKDKASQIGQEYQAASGSPEDV